MKILFVRTYCPNLIFYGSEMRSSRFVDYFRRNGGQVDLMTLTSPSDNTDLNYIRNNFVNFYHFDQENENSRLNSIEKMFHFLPWQITGHYAKNIQVQINEIVEKNQYDLIFIFKLEPLFYFLQLPQQWHAKTIIDFDDILSDLYKDSYKNILTAIKNSFFLRLYEHKALARFKRILVCSHHAVARISAHYRHKVGIVPNIFQINKNQSFPPSVENTRLLFVGSLDYFPNTEGLEWFLKSIWPDFQKVYPQVHLTVIGKARKDITYLETLFGHPKNVTISINVPSVLPYYQECFASVVPLLNGSGTRLKILESVSFNRPVLTTLKGVEGLDFQDHQSLFIFKDHQSFKKAYEALLDNNAYQKITQNAYRILETNYSQNTFDNCMKENMQQAEENTNKAIVLYDGNCALCQRTMKIISFLDMFHQLKLINALSPEAAAVIQELNLKLEDLLFDMHIVEGTKSWKGYQAYQRISLRIPLLWILVPILYFPPIRLVGEGIYRKVADSRTCRI